MIAPLPRLLIEPVVRAALAEDLGTAGDLTASALVPASLAARAALVTRAPGTLAGLDAAALAFTLLDPSITWHATRHDGDRVQAGDTIATIAGPARALLTAERTALNLACHLSGIASVTRRIADSIAHTRARAVCTRKTLPGLRALQKYAVRCGGGQNHRFGLHDGILIKDNHIALAGSIAQALAQARAAAGHMVRIEIEVDRLDQLEEALDAGADAILLDNMDLPTLAEAVRLTAGRATTNASGRVTPETAPSIAETGVDLISIGWITHSAPALDIGLDVLM